MGGVTTERDAWIALAHVAEPGDDRLGALVASVGPVEALQRIAAGATGLQRRLYGWAVRAGASGGPMGWLADLLVLRSVRRELGMTRLRLAYVGELGIPPDVDTWTRALGVTVRSVQELSGNDARYRDLIQRAVAAAGG